MTEHDDKLISDHEKRFDNIETDIKEINKSVQRIERQLTIKKATNGIRTKQMVNEIESLKEKDQTLAEKIDTMGSDIAEIKGLLKGQDKQGEVKHKNTTLIVSIIALCSSAIIGLCSFIL